MRINPANIGFQFGQIAVAAARAAITKGLTPRQVEILAAIPRDWPGITGIDLVRMTEISSRTVYPALKRLKDLEFVENRQDGSRVMYRRLR